jgi:hypothetical protein
MTVDEVLMQLRKVVERDGFSAGYGAAVRSECRIPQ